MIRIILFLSFFLLSTMITSCFLTQKSGNSETKPGISVPGPKVIIYQTNKDYSKLVPVILNDDKTALVSYPDIKDVFYKGSLAYPTQLHKGYLLDNRGIDKNVAFINLTYEEYSKLSKTPTADQLMEMLIDKSPISRMYTCGIRPSYNDIELELNSKIDADDFSAFVKIK
jgi:hypothetical protein